MVGVLTTLHATDTNSYCLAEVTPDTTAADATVSKSRQSNGHVPYMSAAVRARTQVVHSQELTSSKVWREFVLACSRVRDARENNRAVTTNISADVI